jgi:large subunit ribosomal protein L17
MRHRLTFRKLNRNSSQRRALLRGLATQLLSHGRIHTTLERAKELRRYVEPLITLAKVDTYPNRIRAHSDLYGKDIVKSLFDTIAPKYKERPGGYTRIFKLGYRPGDNAKTAIIELVDSSVEKE